MRYPIRSILALSLAFLLSASSAWADTYKSLPATSSTIIWDSTQGYAYGIALAGVPGTTTVWPNLSGSNTFSGPVNFTGTFQIGGTTETFPASGLIVGRTDAQNLTNKTLTSPVITGPAPVACGATCTVGAGNDLTLLNQAAGSVATLQAATGSGNVHKFRVTVLTTSGAEKILTNPTTDTIIGTATGENSGTAKVFVGNAGTYHSIQMPFAGTQPQGGFIGDQITCTDVATGIWACDITYQSGTTPTTPYSASTT